MARINVTKTKAGYVVTQTNNNYFDKKKKYNLGTFSTKVKANRTASIARKLAR